MTKLIETFINEFGSDAVVSSDQLVERVTSYWDSSPTQAKAMLKPVSTEQVSRAMQLCSEHDQTVVVQGGLTGIVDGAVSTSADVIISLERMNQIESVDDTGGVAVIQAGAILQTVQETLANRGFLFPMDFGARGSATIGGATSTNAGGLNVLRYGMMRNLVLGLEAVLADGTVISSMNQMLKNNTGYDLKQLFIGSEGTLGIVTRIVVKLFPMTKSKQTALVATESFEAVIQLLKVAQSELAGTLNAFEVMWKNYFRAVTVDGAHAAPMSRDHAFYVLIEAEGVDPEADDERFQRLLEQSLESGDIEDAVMPKSESERAALWVIREEFEAVLPAYLYDVSLPIKSMSAYVEKLQTKLTDWRAEAEANIFGHIADGNLHIFVTPFDDGKHHELCDEIVYGCLDGFDGSISAEHGIGLEKKKWLSRSRSEDEIELMCKLKMSLDPKNLLNPGKIVN